MHVKLIKTDIDEQKYKRAGLIVVSNNKYLVVFGKNSKKWSFPKGKKNEKELSLVCAIREFEEETGILLESSDFNDIRFFFRTSHCVYYILKLDKDLDFIKNPKHNCEIAKVKYMTISELNSLSNLNYDLKTFVTKYNEFETTQ